MLDPVPRIVVEILSVLVCIILLRFMIKPYLVTREARYLGLPLGFGFLGVSYIVSMIAILEPYYFSGDMKLQILETVIRAFSFTFLAVNYYFSKKPSKNTRLKWDITLSGLIVSSIVTFFIAVIIPQTSGPSIRTINILLRVFMLICLSYITVHCIREHIESPNPTTILVPFGYLILGISQYSHLMVFIEGGEFEFWAALALRLMGLAVFLFVTYRTFYRPKKGVPE
jgi:hypothetical protein